MKIFNPTGINAGVTSIIAGSGISVDQTTGAVTVTAIIPIIKGSATLTTGTTTTITNAGAKTTSVILIQPTCAAMTLLGVWVSTKSNGSFTLTHTTAAGTETFDYLIN